MTIKTEDEGSSAQHPEPVTPALTQTPSSSPRKRTKATSGDDTPRKKAASSTKIPTSFDDASPEDKLIVTMREQEKSWPEIHEAWESLTGTKVSKQYCSVRYHRLRASFAVFEESDVPKLVEAQRIVDAEIEKERLGRIAKVLTSLGGKEYEPLTIQKKIKEMGKQKEIV